MDYDGIGFLKASGADSLSVGYKTASGPKPALRSGRLKGFVRHQSGFGTTTGNEHAFSRGLTQDPVKQAKAPKS